MNAKESINVNEPATYAVHNDNDITRDVIVLPPQVLTFQLLSNNTECNLRDTLR